MPTDIYAAPNANYPLRDGDPRLGAVESAFSAVSWAAIVAGAIGAAAMAMILITLGAGFGLLAVSPWDNEGASATTLGIGVIVWSIVVHAISFGLGGYLAGRLRTKWANIQGDEVYFRDTAHGFVTWALGILVSACVMASIAGGLARGTAEVAAAGAGGAGVAAGSMTGGMIGGDAMNRGGMNGYFSDMLLRPAAPTADAAATATGTQLPAAGATTPAPATSSPPNDGMVRGEVGRILTTSLSNGEISPADKTYLAQMISARTGMPQADAEKRVDEVIAQAKASIEQAKEKAKQVADDARKAASGMALWAFVAMLVGAFCASYAATIGGRNRDL